VEHLGLWIREQIRLYAVDTVNHASDPDQVMTVFPLDRDQTVKLRRRAIYMVTSFRACACSHDSDFNQSS
jgi:hypothetical protein